MSHGQSSLFDDDALPVAPGLVALPGSEKVLSPAQRRFNQLVARIAAERERVAAWEAAHERYRSRRAGELPPLQARVRAGQRALVEQLDRILAEPDGAKPRLTKRRREAVREALVALVVALLEIEHDEALAALHDKHADLSLEEQKALDLDIAREMFADVFGDDAVPGGEHASVDDFMEAAHQGLADRVQAQQAREEAAKARRAARRRAQGKGPTKKERDAQAREHARQQAGQSLRQVFRKLASQLHPDRADDADDRARRTALMQKVNQAYEASDLLTMLSLQLEVEQLDLAGLAALPDEQIQHYIVVLEEQLQALQGEVGEIVGPLRAAGRPARSPSELDALLDDEREDLESVARGIETDLPALADAKRRVPLIDGWIAQARQREDELADSELAAMLLGAFEPPRGRRRR